MARKEPSWRTKGLSSPLSIGSLTNGSAVLNSMTKSMRENLSLAGPLPVAGLLPVVYTEQSGFKEYAKLPCGASSDKRLELTIAKFPTCGEMIWFWKSKITCENRYNELTNTLYHSVSTLDARMVSINGANIPTVNSGTEEPEGRGRKSSKNFAADIGPTMKGIISSASRDILPFLSSYLGP